MSSKRSPVPKLVDALHLQELPNQGGWFRRTLDTHERSQILHLLGGDEFSAIHRLTADEEYRFVAGTPLRLLLLDEEGPREEIVSDQHPRVTVRAGCWQGSSAAGGWSLVSTTVSPAFDWSMFSLGDRDELRRKYPLVARRIDKLTR